MKQTLFRRFRSVLTALLLLPAVGFGQQAAPKQPADYVDPLIGTAPSSTESARRHSEAGSELKGQTFPATGVPHALTQWTPQTHATEQKCLSPYYYQETRIQGFRGSRWMSGSCTQDYGSLTLMPMTGKLVTDVAARASAYSHDREKALPYAYSVTLDDYGINAELTGTTRSGIMSFAYTKAGEQYLVIEPNSDEGQGYVEIHPEKNEIVGFNPVHRIYQGWGEPAGFSGYFVAVFDTPFSGFGTWNGEAVTAASKSSQGRKTAVGAYVQFAPKAGRVVRVRIGTSCTSLEGARRNLQAEIPGWNLAQVKQSAARAWNAALGKVQVKGGTEADKVQFYTALYHANILPRIFSDADGAYPGFAEDSTIHQAKGFDYYDDFSLWDTFRGVHPLMTILEPVRTGHMMESLVQKARQGGWLPIFPSWNHYTAAMIGDHATSALSDAYVKGIRNFDYATAYQYMRKNAFQVNTDSASYRSGKGRRALASYLQYGYVPLEDSVWDAFHKREQVSRTLEYAYDDFAVAQMAKGLNRLQDYGQLIQRATNYRKVYDPKTGYVRGRYANGDWYVMFNPFAPRASFITEGSPAQYTFFVPHDVAGLVRLSGGPKKFEAKLDTLFNGRHYWHGNEPNHQIPYLYPYAGVPWKTQQRVRQIIRAEYSAEPGGLSGNEDAGQMSAWLAFSMMGFYPVCPGMPYYVLGSPWFNEMTISLPGNKKFTLRATNQSAENAYIQSAKLNGQPFTRTYLRHEEITAGGELTVEMGPQPNFTWGTGADDAPPSLGMERMK